MKRSPMPPRRKPLAKESSRRKAQRERRREVVAESQRIHGAICLLHGRGECFGYITGHELVKSSQKRDARITQALVIPLCVFHNGWVEDQPIEAWHLGVAVPRWVWDRHGQAALDEAARLRYVWLSTGRAGTPFWYQPRQEPST